MGGFIYLLENSAEKLLFCKLLSGLKSHREAGFAYIYREINI